MNKVWKGKGVPMKIGMVTGALIALMLMGAVKAQAGFRVMNEADLVYYTSAQLKVAYTSFDTALIVVLYGPKMTIQKWVVNEVTGESTTSDTQGTHVSRGESITFHLYSQNDVPGDTDAWGVMITDTFSALSSVIPSTTPATVGADTTTKTFTFIPGSANCDTTVASYMTPDSVSYCESGGTWTGWAAYAAGIATVNGLKTITGIRWYWNHIASKTVWDDASNSNIASGRPYLIHVWFSLLRNDN
jgi:hypothetical protein